MKKNIIMIIFIILTVLFINNSSVRADFRIDSFVDGSTGNPSVGCSKGAGACANTVGIFSSFPNTPIFGMKISLFDDNGKDTGKSGNFFPSTDMRDLYIAKTGTHNNYYKRGIFFDKLESNMNGSTSDQVDYEKIISNVMLNDSNAEKNMEEIYNIIKGDLKLSFDDILNKGYYYVIQPVFILHMVYYNQTDNESHSYYFGTLQDIIYDMLRTSGDGKKNRKLDDDNLKYKYESSFYKLTFDSKKSETKRYVDYYSNPYPTGNKCNERFNSGNKNFARSLSLIGGGNWCESGSDWNVLDNYVRNPVISQSNPLDFNSISLGNNSHKNILYKAIDAIRNKSVYGKALIKISDYGKPKTTKVIVNKYKGTNGTNCYDKDVTFELKSTNTNYSKKITYSAGSCDSIVFDSIPEDYYVLVEKNVSGIDSIKFQMDGSEKTVNPSSNDIESFKFKVKNGQSKKMNVWNLSLTEECKKDVIDIFETQKNSVDRSYELIKLYKEKYKDKINGKINFSNLVNFSENEVIMSKDSLSDSDAANLCKTAELVISNNILACTGDSYYYLDKNKSFISGKSASYIASDDSIQLPDLGDNTYCYVKLHNKLNFNEVKVKAGQLLWRYDIGTLDATLHCDGYYRKDNVNHLTKTDNVKSVVEGLIPNGKISWTTGGDTYKQNIGYELKNIEANGDNVSLSTNNDVNLSNAHEGEYYIHATLDVTFNYNLGYDKYWYSYGNLRMLIDNEIFTKKGEKKQYKYKKIGSGLPISVTTKTGNYKAKVEFDDKSVTCPYSVYNEILRNPNDPYDPDNPNTPDNPDKPLEAPYEFNFNFRIIDTSNPFPGLRGKGRLTGSNWCLSNRIGTIIPNENEDDNILHFVGDINDDGVIDENDLNIKYDMYRKIGNLGDINEDGVTEYSSDCNNDITDNCILKSYVKENFNDICSSDNEVVKKYITDKKSSNSNETPMYSFTLTPTEIKAIRNYNKEFPYNDFNMKCVDGNKCLSYFITNWMNKLSKDNSSCYEIRSGKNGKWCNNN